MPLLIMDGRDDQGAEQRAGFVGVALAVLLYLLQSRGATMQFGREEEATPPSEEFPAWQFKKVGPNLARIVSPGGFALGEPWTDEMVAAVAGMLEEGVTAAERKGVDPDWRLKDALQALRRDRDG